MSIRERVANFLNPEQQQRIDELSESVRMLYLTQQEQWINAPAPEMLIKQLQEQGYDSGYLYDLINQLGWEEIGVSGISRRGGERERAVRDSRQQWIYSPLYQWAVWVWTNYGFGQQVTIVPTDEDAIETWTEFWTADRNDPVLGADNIQMASTDTLVDGNLYWAYHASDQDGETTITEIDPDEIVEILRHPRNSRFHVFYKRTFLDGNTEKTWYYPSWLARSIKAIDQPFDRTGKTVAEFLKVPDNQRTDKMDVDADAVGERRPGTVSVIQPIHWNRKDKKDPFGWPLLTAAGPWLRSHGRFVSHRLTVSAAKAMFVRRKTVKGGSRAVNATISAINTNVNRNRYLDSNAAAAAGSVEVENRAVNTEDLPMRTGADDAKTDNEIFTWMPSLALGLYPHYMGLGDSYRLATASSMEKPLEMQWDRYQSFWQAQFRRMFRIVIEFKNEFGGTDFDTTATVTMDRVTEFDLDGAADGIGKMFTDVFQPALDAGLLDPDVYSALVGFMVNYTLEALGGNDLSQSLQVQQAQKSDAGDSGAQPTGNETQESVPPGARVMIQALQNYLDGAVPKEDTIAFLMEEIQGE
jgi:hypothetical protein